MTPMTYFTGRRLGTRGAGTARFSPTQLARQPRGVDVGDRAAARLGAGQIAISPPATAIAPPIQIQITNGLRLTRKSVGTGLATYSAAMLRITWP